MNPTLVVWWRYGKEHDPSGSEFRANPPEVVAAHLDEKVARNRALTATRTAPDWRWWQVDECLLVERADPNAFLFDTDTRIYYLVDRGLAVVENIHFPPPSQRWRWYVHLADIFYDAGRECWVKKDLFADIIVDRDRRTHRVLDLDDLATALDLGLVTPAETSRVLRQTSLALRGIARGEFPFPEIERARAACRELGWPSTL